MLSSSIGKPVMLEKMVFLGDANVRFLQDFDGKNLVGIDATDPNGLDDVVVQELHLPVGREKLFSKCDLKTYFTQPICLTLEHK